MTVKKQLQRTGNKVVMSQFKTESSGMFCQPIKSCKNIGNYEGRTESHEQLFFACELGTADEGECGGRWNQLLCYP